MAKQPIYTIRKAKLSDAGATANFAYALSKQHQAYDKKLYKLARDARKRFFEYHRNCIHAPNKIMLVAESNGTLVGYAIASIRKRPPVYTVKFNGHLDAVYIEKKWRRKGIASAFMKELLPWYKKKGVNTITLMVDVDNMIGMKVWDAIGYEPYLQLRKLKLR
ncbi:MAG: GNAT family N-acetyltransferase [Candidatus Kerfeldbacteria bacterium]